jgi:membrane protein DedA with SNARE-associated domain
LRRGFTEATLAVRLRDTVAPDCLPPTRINGVVDDAAIAVLAGSPWLFPAVFLLVVGDAFLVVLPSETVVVALAALSGATGAPSLWAIIGVAAAGAMVGDSCCYLIGRRVGSDRWAWQRVGRVARAIARARATVLERPAVLIFTARYIPFARIAVNLSAGAVGLPYRRFLPLSVAAGIGWALYNCGVGLFFGSLLPENPVLAIVVSVVVAIALGVLVDLAVSRVAAARRRRTLLRAESTDR